MLREIRVSFKERWPVTQRFSCAVYDYTGKADISKSYWNLKENYISHTFSEIIKSIREPESAPPASTAASPLRNFKAIEASAMRLKGYIVHPKLSLLRSTKLTNDVISRGNEFLCLQSGHLGLSISDFLISSKPQNNLWNKMSCQKFVALATASHMSSQSFNQIADRYNLGKVTKFGGVYFGIYSIPSIWRKRKAIHFYVF